MTSEPVLILNVLGAAVNGIQIAALSLPTWAHTLIVVLSFALATVSRQLVTPTASASSSSSAV